MAVGKLMLARLHIPARLEAMASALVVCALLLVACTAVGLAAELREIRYWSLGDVTRVVVQVNGEFTYKWNRLEDPPRIFFDLPQVELALVKRGADRGRVRSIEVNDALLRQIRYAENAPGRARVVLDLNESCEVSTSQLANPARLVIELRSRKATSPGVQVSRSGVLDAGAPEATSVLEPARPEPAMEEVAAARNPALPESGRSTVPATVPPSRPDMQAAPRTRASQAAPPSVAPQPASRSAAQEATAATNRALEALEPTATTSLAPDPPAAAVSVETVANASATPAIAVEPNTVTSSSAVTGSSTSGSLPQPVDASAAGPGASDEPEAPIATPAKRTANGRQSLVRALGLKIGRVVIDPGHGGKDHGTTGVSGLREKDLVLDVSLRLAQLVRERLGSEVVLTREDDVFVPLEERTEIANRSRADLFLSVHANSSPYKLAMGSETFFLNFTASREAMDVAARENASSQRSVGELQDIVRKIALKDKRDESEDFAARVQGALFRTQKREGFAPKNRGVKAAPFIVLVGAEMPSVLVEIGFLSNAKEEAALKTPGYRQKIAEALLSGLEDYFASLSHFEGRERASVRE